MFDDYEREKNVEWKKFICEQNKERNKDNTEMDDHTKVNIFCKRVEEIYESYERTRGTKFWITVEKNNIEV